MKRLFTLITTVLLTASLFSQSPQKISYQAVIRNGSDQLVTNHVVGIRVSILQGSSSGTAMYVETQTPSTNANGLISIEIGGGTIVTGTFAGIDWSASTYFIKTETDPTGGTSYSITGTSQLLSVPYALYAKTVASYPETDPIFGVWNKSSGISITASQVNDFQTSVTNNAAMLANTAKNSYPGADAAKLAAITGTNTGDETATTIKSKLGISTLSGSNTGDQTLVGLGGVASNTLITGETKTKITYDTKGLVTSGADATTADIEASTNKNYVTDAELTLIGNTSGTNSGDNAVNTLYSGLVTNATHTGDVTGSGILTLATVNSNIGTFNNITINAKGLATAGSNVSYLTSEADPSWTTASVNYYTKANMQTSGASQLHFNNITNKPSTLEGYSIYDAVNTTGDQTIAGVKTFSNKIIVSQQGIGTSTPDASSALEISSTTQGFLPPRMTLVQRDAITAVEGLIVYNTTTKKPNYYNGFEWINYDGTSAGTIAIGSHYHGGIVAYILQSGDPGYDIDVLHGLIAAPSDQATGIQWYNGTYTTTGATATALGTGNANSDAIVRNLGDGSYAAKLCYDLVLNGYSDWYLPSKDELNKLYLNKVAIGGFATGIGYYWSSTEYLNDLAWIQDFFYGNQLYYSKDYPYHVRAIRAF